MRRLLAPAFLLSLTSIATSGPAAAPAGPAVGPPDAAVKESIAALRSNDLAKLLQATLPADQYAEMKSGWKKAQKETTTPEQAAEFSAQMAMLTAPGAEDMLMAMVEPQLAQMEPQLDMMVGMLSGMISSSLEQNELLGESEKTEGRRWVKAFSAFLLEGDILSREKARRTVGIVCKTARKLELETLAQAQALSFEQVLAKGSLCLGATKDVLDIYGLSLDDLLDSIAVKTVSQEGDDAVVELKFELFGEKQTVRSQLTRVDDRWIRNQGNTSTAAPTSER
jgi:hypothetical protein